MTQEIEAVIGLEVHAQLSTDSKIFATSSTVVGCPPNTLTDPLTLALPGSLPVLNKLAVEFAVKLGLATGCGIARESIFARKHYMYPDLPKGYQISQYEKPVCKSGHLEIRINGNLRTVGITRIHLEEDAGKNVHHANRPYSSVDLNRAGVALVEIVSEPDLRSPEEAGAYMRQIRQILRYLDISDGNMEEGSLRCDANVSVRAKGETKLGEKVEIKNLNSFKFVESALAYEIERQTALLREGKQARQETRLWDEAKGETRVMRTKEHAQDYRYFPDPDLLPLVIDNNWIEKIRATLPELPVAVYKRFLKMYRLDEYTAEVLTQERFVAQYYDQAVSAHNNPIGIANWISSELFGLLNKETISIEKCPVSPENLAALVQLIDSDVISGKIAKTVFAEMFSTSATPMSIVESRGLKQVSNPELIQKAIDEVIASNPEQVSEYRSGKTKLFGFFVGQLMKITQGKANPQLLNDLLKISLENKKD